MGRPYRKENKEFESLGLMSMPSREHPPQRRHNQMDRMIGLVDCPVDALSHPSAQWSHHQNSHGVRDVAIDGPNSMGSLSKKLV